MAQQGKVKLLEFKNKLHFESSKRRILCVESIVLIRNHGKEKKFK
jgi:hypothetical protein